MNNNRKKTPSGQQAGQQVREQAITRLAKVLNGAPFIPFNEAIISDSRDRALANKLITTALRRHGHINYIFEQQLKKGMPARSANFESILRIALAELLFMPKQAEHSSIFLAVEIAKKNNKTRHLAKLVNGVLRTAQREAEKYKGLPNHLLFPKWLIEKWQKSYGAEVIEDFAQALLEGAPLDLILRNEGESEKLISELNGQKIFHDVVRIYQRDKAVDKMAGYDEGSWWVQDVAASLPARLMALKKNASILDMCVAPGGKLAQLLKQDYQVTGLDIDKERLKRVKENLERLKYSAKLEVSDARTYSPKTLFDGILLDAPCSATGTFRRHPELIWQRKQHDIKQRVKLQRELIANAIKCLKPNGVLIFITCSLEIEEGEQQANWISKTYKELEEFPIKKEEILDFGHFISKDGYLRTLPIAKIAGNISGSMDGFFVARFRRV
ncbi:MAG: methyltransferase domain-containing protein [Devosiaceae bacterium]|nr:methyltransferase domain-containing protein [Devosiaceae bacterium]